MKNIDRQQMPELREHTGKLQTRLYLPDKTIAANMKEGTSQNHFIAVTKTKLSPISGNHSLITIRLGYWLRVRNWTGTSFGIYLKKL
jgi:hypothetical protein